MGAPLQQLSKWAVTPAQPRREWCTPMLDDRGETRYQNTAHPHPAWPLRESLHSPPLRVTVITRDRWENGRVLPKPQYRT